MALDGPMALRAPYLRSSGHVRGRARVWLQHVPAQHPPWSLPGGGGSGGCCLEHKLRGVQLKCPVVGSGPAEGHLRPTGAPSVGHQDVGCL